MKASRPPRGPARAVPTATTIWVEVGPGRPCPNPSNSTKRCSSSQPRRATNRSCSRAMWAWGPPKAIHPRGRKAHATSASLRAREGVGWLSLPEELFSMCVPRLPLFIAGWWWSRKLYPLPVMPASDVARMQLFTFERILILESSYRRKPVSRNLALRYVAGAITSLDSGPVIRYGVTFFRRKDGSRAACFH